MINGQHYTCTEIKEKLFVEVDEEIRDYEPDVKLHTPNGDYWIEIKVQMKPKGENVHIKENQINKLVQLEGFVLYSTADEYFIHRASYLKSISNGVIFSNRLHKRCYDIDSDKLQWNKWLHKPEYYKYPKRNYYGNYTKKQEGKR